MAKQILQVTHVKSDPLGQNFINLDVFKSAGNDPAQGGGTGATEAYVMIRNQFQYGKVFGTPLAFGPVRDMALTAGFDYNTKNTTFGPNKRMLGAGADREAGDAGRFCRCQPVLRQGVEPLRPRRVRQAGKPGRQAVRPLLPVQRELGHSLYGGGFAAQVPGLLSAERP